MNKHHHLNALLFKRIVIQIQCADTRLRYGNPSRLSSIWNSSKSSFPKSSDKLTKAKGNDLVEITDAGNVDTVDTVGTEGTSNLIPPAVSYVDSIEKAVPESRWKKDAVWRNIESPLIPFDLTDDEVHSIGSAAFHTADSCTTDDCIAPAHGINHLNATYDKRTSLTTVLQSQKFGFVPKIALTQSSKDLAKDINSENCTSYSMIEQKMQIDKSIPCAVEDLKASPNNNDHVQALFGVSEMLTVLKHYVRNSR